MEPPRRQSARSMMKKRERRKPKEERKEKCIQSRTGRGCPRPVDLASRGARAILAGSRACLRELRRAGVEAVARVRIGRHPQLRLLGVDRPQEGDQIESTAGSPRVRLKFALPALV